MPGEHGIFDLHVNGRPVFSKLEKDRFPEIMELGEAIRKILDDVQSSN